MQQKERRGEESLRERVTLIIISSTYCQQQSQSQQQLSQQQKWWWKQQKSSRSWWWWSSWSWCPSANTGVGAASIGAAIPNASTAAAAMAAIDMVVRLCGSSIFYYSTSWKSIYAIVDLRSCSHISQLLFAICLSCCDRNENYHKALSLFIFLIAREGRIILKKVQRWDIISN